jgi:hypothetical protein
MRRVVFVTVILVGLLGAAGGCARPAPSPAAPGTLAPTTPTAPPSDRAQIYAAVLLGFLARHAASIGGAAPTALYVLDEAHSDAGPDQAMHGEPARSPIPAEDQAAVLALMRGKSGIPVSFVAPGAAPIPSGDGCGRGTFGAVLVTLAPVPTTVATGGAPFEVGIHGTMGCMTFVGVAYPMTRGPDGWVAGEATHFAIA